MFTVIIFYIIVIILLASKLCIWLCFQGGKKKNKLSIFKETLPGKLEKNASKRGIEAGTTENTKSTKILKILKILNILKILEILEILKKIENIKSLKVSTELNQRLWVGLRWGCAVARVPFQSWSNIKWIKTESSTAIAGLEMISLK